MGYDQTWRQGLTWAEGFILDYQEHTNQLEQINFNVILANTCQIFSTWQGFIGHISAGFETLDEKGDAVRSLEGLRQKGLAMAYTREFKRHSKQTEWNEEALSVQYYKRLKNKLKDEISQKDKPDTSKELIKLIYNIDNQFYIWDFEKKKEL